MSSAIRDARTIGKLRWGIATCLAVAIIARAAWVASHTEGGWWILREQLVAGVPPVLHFWDYRDDDLNLRESQWILEQAEKVANDPKSTADDLMGAALVSGAVYDRPEIANSLSIGAAIWRPLPHPDVNLEQRPDWRTKLWKLSSELARKATLLEPERVDSWRLRTVAGVQPGIWGFDLEALRIAAEQDPDNALHEYLIAIEYYRAAIGRTRENGDLYIAIPASLQASKEHYEKALTKPILAMGEPATTAAGRFLARAGGAITFKMGCYSPTSFHSARSAVVGAIGAPGGIYSQEELAGVPQNDVTRWFAKQHLNTDWLRQWKKSGETAWYEIANRPWGDVLPTSAEPLMSGLQGWQTQQWWNRGKEDEYKIWSVAGVAASAVVVMFLLLSLAAYVVAWWMNRSESNNSGGISLWRALLFWLIAFVPMFAIFGILPTFKPKLADYHWSITAACIAAVVVITGWACWLALRFIFRQGRLARPQRSRYYQIVRWSMVVVVSAVFVIVMQTAIDRHFRRGTIDFFKDFPRQVIGEVEQMRIGPGSSAWLSSQVGVVNETWPWTVIQWGAHWGLFWTTGLWLLLIVAFGARPSTNGGKPTQFSDYLKPIAKAAFALGLLFLLISIASSTQWMISLREKYEQKLARLADPGWLVKQIEADAQKQQEELQLDR